MGDISKIYTPQELQDLDEAKKSQLQAELNQQLNAEARAIIRAYHDMNARLKQDLNPTLNRLKPSR